MSILSADLDIVNQILGHRLDQDDITRILSRLSSDDQQAFRGKLADILRKTSVLLEVSRRVSECLSLEVLLPRMVELISEFLHAERTTIFLHDVESNELFSQVAQGDLASEIRVPHDAGLVGHVFASGEPLLVPDAYADWRFNPEVDRKTGYKTRNVLSVPILHREQPIGVIQVLNRIDGAFSEADITLLRSIAAQASAGFENARLHDQIARARRNEVELLEITTAISRELQLKPLLQEIMATVTRFLGADRSTLFLYDPKRGELWSQIAQGTAEIRFPAHLGIAGAVFTSGVTINIPDAYADRRFNQEIDRKTGYKTDTILCMPVQSKKGTTLGVIQVLNRKGGPFSQQDEKRLAAFCAQASIAIENAQLFEEVVQIKNYNESILESMSNGVLTVSADGVIVTANRAALKLFQLAERPEELLGKEVGAFFGLENAWVIDSIARVTDTGAQDISMDMDLELAARGNISAVKASVNLSAVPLKNARGGPMGCMLMIEDLSREKRLRGTMARYMAKEVADKLLEEGEDALGGTIQTASVLFSDIRSFTTISERIGAQATVSMLNDYFSIMVDIILGRNGILDKFIGDAIMAVFGAPFPGPRDADNAVGAAIDMLRALSRFNASRVAAGVEPIQIGVGINTDEILSGNIGSQKRMDYTVIGDGVNLASRLEGANKPYGTQILISELTVKALKDPYRLREVDRIRVKGKTEPVAVYEVMDHLYPDAIPALENLLAQYETALALYWRRDWKSALRAYEKALEHHATDGVSRQYRERCLYFIEHPPPADWDGVWEMKSK